jgi:hypothetical protein
MRRVNYAYFSLHYSSLLVYYNLSDAFTWSQFLGFANRVFPLVEWGRGVGEWGAGRVERCIRKGVCCVRRSEWHMS